MMDKFVPIKDIVHTISETHTFNAEKLYADLFVRANFGRLLIRDSSGQTIVNPNKNGTELSEIELKNIVSLKKSGIIYQQMKV